MDIAELNKRMKSPFWELLNLQIIETNDERVVLKLPVHQGLTQPYGFVHGGAIATLIDSAIASLMTCTLKQHEETVTIEMKVNYLSSTRDKDLFAEASLVKRGKTISVAMAIVRDVDGKDIAIGTATFFVRKKT
ncbi:PaaI family thioesterase [Microaerobacter geothermalis]|nr:PaaI family thioesterase [Microaerobacter geothermalis]